MNFRDLDVYKTAIRFQPIAAQIASAFPAKYSSLADQLRRAALSIPLNIAEGSGKTGGPDQRRFYAIARGSSMESAAIVDVAVALALVDSGLAEEADRSLLPIVQMLSRMCRDS